MRGKILGETGRKGFRKTMGQFCTGVVVATAFHDKQPIGLTLQSFVSISLEPLLVAISPGKNSVTWPLIREAGSFCINILAQDQQIICETMSKSGKDKFTGIEWSPSDNGFPVFPGNIATIECGVESEYEAGDHTIVIGRVTNFELNDHEKDPLVFFRGAYGTVI